MALKVFTSQYRYSGPHRLDITVKGKDPVGKVFAPTWNMVTRYKADSNDEEYIKEFHKLILASFELYSDVWLEDLLKRKYVVLVCFCPAGAFCHRTLVADYLTQLGAEYIGEISEWTTKAHYYVHHESDCVWVSTDPNEAHELVEEIDVHSFRGLITNGYTNNTKI